MDFSKGIIYKTNSRIVPTIDEIKNFCTTPKEKQSQFFSKFFPYIMAVYGTEIHEIVNEIEQNMYTKLSNKPKNNHI